MARWLDLDQDGDRDLYLVNYRAAEHADKAFLADNAPPPALPTRPTAPVWARNESKRLTARELLVTPETPGVEGLALADLVGQPLVYDYNYADPAPLARMSGKLTRYGDVACLLQADDDRFRVVGPGDEARLEFEAADLPPLPAGWTRAYVLRAFGYCKDADPFTATSDTIEPLPWRGMPAFPFAAGVTRPATAAHDDYLREFQTRRRVESSSAGSTLRVKADVALPVPGHVVSTGTRRPFSKR